MNPSITIERKRIDNSALPKGWQQRDDILRKTGISAGKADVYCYSQTGKKIDSKMPIASASAVARQLDSLEVSLCDYQPSQSGKVHSIPPPSISIHRGVSSTASSTLKRKFSTSSKGADLSIAGITGLGMGMSCTSITPTTSSPAPAYSGSSSSLRQQLEYSRPYRTDVSLVPPIRQTASIFKQPVTVIRNHENGKVKHDIKHGNQEKPKQLFWEKRLERMFACNADGEELNKIELPRGIKSVGPNVNEQTVLQSIATALHVSNSPVTGQTASKAELNSNSGAFLNPKQPLMQSVAVSEDDIRRQEERVNNARKKLQDLLKV